MPLPPAVDVTAVAREAATAAVAQYSQELERVVFSDRPYPQLPLTTGKPQYPIAAYDRPIFFATPQAPFRRPDSQVTYQSLRHIADLYDVLRACIQHLKREVSAIPIEIVPRDDADTTAATLKAIAEAKAWFEVSGGLGGTGRRRSHFESALIEDLCVIGAACCYFSPARSGKPYEVVAIDAATIRPRVNAWGWPTEGDEVYEQWILGRLSAAYTRKELWYDGIYAVSHSPYYRSPSEYLLFVAMSGMRADEWNRVWLTDGTTPADLIALPEEWTADQILQWNEFWTNLLSGDSRKRQQTRFVPGGSQKVGSTTRKDQDFQEYELWLLRRCCAIMGVQPASIGYAGEQYKVSQDASMTSTTAYGVGVLLDYLKALYDEVLRRLGWDDLEIKHVSTVEEAGKERAERLTKLVAGGIYTPNEARQAEGRDAMPGGDTLFLPASLQSLEKALAAPEPQPGTGTVPGEPGEEEEAGGEETGSETATAESEAEQRAALQRWERKALNRVRRGQRPQCEFASACIAEAVSADVWVRLAACYTAEDVRAVFQSVDVSLARFDENQPRDSHGRWKDTGAYRTATDGERRDFRLTGGQYKAVYYNTDPKGKIGAVGILQDGSEKPVYRSQSLSAEEKALGTKFERLRQFDQLLPKLMARVKQDAAAGKPEAGVLLLQHRMGFRVGGEGAASKVKSGEAKGETVATFGASSLQKEHVRVSANAVTFEFTGKSAKKQQHISTDPVVIALVKAQAKREGDKLFDTNHRKVRDYLKAIDGDYKTHDFRSWHATDLARRSVSLLPVPQNARELARAKNAVADKVAARLGDERATVLKHYIDPQVWTSWERALE